MQVPVVEHRLGLHDSAICSARISLMLPQCSIVPVVPVVPVVPALFFPTLSALLPPVLPFPETPPHAGPRSMAASLTRWWWYCRLGSSSDWWCTAGAGNTLCHVLGLLLPLVAQVDQSISDRGQMSMQCGTLWTAWTDVRFSLHHARCSTPLERDIGFFDRINIQFSRITPLSMAHYPPGQSNDKPRLVLVLQLARRLRL
ncbi:hypothetical protein GE09DRAFT_787741 [Coniochaeta sp. 2T2.1]|nr:hypothetical protein GE09DRAFT_787741 [Coniochaeta sp. 2T2.1]